MKNKKYFYTSTTIIALVTCISLYWNIHTINVNTYQLVKSSGRSFFTEILTTRLWNAKHGGVYVPITKSTQPNPYLDVPNRDVITKSGIKLTLINPAFMTREIAEIDKKENNIHYHITSLKPIRPQNMADEWERKALTSFENGTLELITYFEKDIAYRYMAPLFVKQDCLKCHAKQGYRVGDVRGGISITIPANTFNATSEKSKINIIVTHAIIFLIGVILTYYFKRIRDRHIEILNKNNTELEKEISERKKAEETTKISENQYRNLYNKTPVMLISIDLNKKIVSVSDFWCKELGYSREEVIGKEVLEFLTNKSRKIVTEIAIQELIKKGHVNNVECQFVKKDGYVIDILLSAILDDKKEGVAVKSLAVLHDITKIKKSEKRIKESLKEKETLIHEIHHRVKNNMNVVSSLLKLQANNIDNEQTKGILKESQNRIYTMSAIHESIHGSENLSEIDLKKYLFKISTSVFQSSSVDPEKVKLRTDIEEVPISINHASPLGLTINELISNSLKYAFPDGRKGEINVILKKHNENEAELTVSDNGVGMPDGFNWKTSKSLGLKLVRTLVENQLDGSLDMQNNNGTKFTIKFNIGS